MNARNADFVEYSLPADINPKEIRLRHMIDYEILDKTVSKIDSKQRRFIKDGQSATKRL